MNKLALLLLLGVMPAFGQTFNRVDGSLQNALGQALSGATVYVCTQPCISTLIPPSPLATIYSDSAGTPVTNAGQVTTDGNGNFNFYASSLALVTEVFVYRGKIVKVLPDQVVTAPGNANGINCPVGTSAIPYFTGSLYNCDQHASFDGLGNQVDTSLVATTVTATTVATTGPGWVKTVQCQTAPANPPAGSIVFYCDSGTGLFATRNSSGGSANPGGATFGTVTSGTNSNAGTFAASGNTWDYTGVTVFKMRIGAGLTTSVNGDFGYDTTNKNWHAFGNAVDNFLGLFTAAGTYVANDCVKITSINPLVLADSGGACGASGSASPIMFTSGQGFGNTSTQFTSVGFITTNEASTQMPVPRSGTVSNLQCHVSAALSSAQTLVFTVRKGAASITPITSADTTLTCTLNSTNTTGCSDGTHNFTVAAGDVLDIKSVPANTPASGVINCSVQLL